jgi:Dolichyl-phosphate-mannose-protein mannosyltransferase
MDKELAVNQPRLSRPILLVAGAIFLCVMAVVSLTVYDPGLTWDEPIYISFAGEHYIAWTGEADGPPQRPRWGALTEDGDSGKLTWGRYQVHPPLGKLWIAFSMTLLGQTLGGVRTGAGILLALTAMMLFLWQWRRGNTRTGIFAALALVLMPRIFAHGHFANLELPMVVVWLATVIAFEKGIRSKRWSIACGVIFGLALLTKINGAFLPVVLIPWGLIFHGRKALNNILAMLLIGPMLFLCGWPLMWRHPIGGPMAYLAYWGGFGNVKRMALPVYYLGRIYRETPAPWHYPFVLLAATTPLPILATFLFAIGKGVRKARAEWRKMDHEILLAWNIFFYLLLFAMPNTPKYDGMRLLLPAMPFVAALAGRGAEALWQVLRGRVRNASVAAWGAGGIIMLWLLLPIVAFHPFQLCYYSELVGGPWGARGLGLETTYWNDTFTTDAQDWLLEHGRPGDRIAPIAIGSFGWRMMLQSESFQKARLFDGNFADGTWNWLVVMPRQGYWTEAEREYIRTHSPEKVWYLTSLQKTPICMIFQKR